MPSLSGARPVLAGLTLVAACALAGCGSDSEPDGSADAPESYHVAYLSASAANTWLAASEDAMRKVADENNVEITDFDAQFKPGEQSKQIQDIIATKDYDGLVIASVDGAGIIPDLEKAIDAGLQVAVLNQVIGTDLTTPDPQFDGAAVSVLAPPLKSGERLGAVTLQACEGIDPCRVVYFYGIKGTPLDTALRDGFDSVIADNPAIEVVADPEGQYLGPDAAMKSTQEVLAAHPDFDVVVGADQSIQGAQLALQDAGIDGVKLIGLGGSEPALAGIADGSWFGGVFGAPATEGTLAMEALVKALQTGETSGGIDTGTAVPNDALMNQDNVGDFTAEWAG